MVWYELFLYCARSMRDQRILQRELPFFLLLRWKYSLEGRNESDYLAACQMIVAEDIQREKWELLRKKIVDIPDFEIKEVLEMVLDEATEGTTGVWYQAQWEGYQGNMCKKQRRKYQHSWLLIYALSVFLISFYFVLSVIFIYNRM